QLRRHQTSQKKPRSAQIESSAKSLGLSDPSNDPGSDATQGARAVIGKAQGPRPYAGREDLAADDARAGKKSRPEESDNRPQHKQRCRRTRPGVKRHQKSGGKKVEHERSAAAQMVRNPAKADVTGKHTKQVEHDKQSSRTHDAETTPALCDWQRQIRRNPGKQSPPGKQPEEVEQKKDESALAIRRAKNEKERIILIVWRGRPRPRTAATIVTLGFQAGNVAFSCHMVVQPHLRF